MMTNLILLIIFGLIVIFCVHSLIRFTKKLDSSDEHRVLTNSISEEKDIKTEIFCLFGALIGFFIGLILGYKVPNVFFPDSFWKTEGGGIGAILILALIFCLVGAFLTLFICGLLSKKKA